jgi:hypothetical protein
MNVNDISLAILNGDFSNSDLNNIGDAINYAKKRLADKSISSLNLGDLVSFSTRKDNTVYKGSIVKIALKYVNVKTADGVWKVPANVLSKLSA